jgi:hypothetical protein
MSYCDAMGGSEAASVEERGRVLNQFVGSLGTISIASGHNHAGTEDRAEKNQPVSITCPLKHSSTLATRCSGSFPSHRPDVPVPNAPEGSTVRPPLPWSSNARPPLHACTHGDMDEPCTPPSHPLVVCIQKPRPRPKPGQAKPGFTALARPGISESQSRLRPGQRRGFQANPGRNITTPSLATAPSTPAGTRLRAQV